MFRLILGQVMPKSKIGDQLENTAYECMEHLAKLWMFPDAEEVNHWRKEVWGFYKNVPRVKPRNKYPKPEFVFDCIWTRNQNELSRTIKSVPDIEDELVPNTTRVKDVEGLERAMSDYFLWISDRISEDGGADFGETKQKLISLGF